ncbi:MAG: acetate--CoA ligase family protein [Candidatus Geothermincolia bacterium]
MAITMAARSSRSSDKTRLSKAFFEPRSLAVIGASSHPDKVGYSVLANIVKSGYEGEIWPVNPKAAAIQDIECFKDVQELPGAPELAVVIVPAPLVPDTVGKLATMGTPYAVIISAGFKETGIEGRRLERETVERAHAGGMRLLGPNCLGIMNTTLPLNASFARKMPPKGTIGVISQSGAICTSLIDWARDQSVGFSKLISLGNNSDLVESDFLESLTEDAQTTVISMYLEGVSDGERFFESLKIASRAKPVVLLKAGVTQAGAQAASSHTGALAGSESAYEALCDQASVLRAGSVEELVELSCAFATQPVPKGPRIAIVTNAGGPGIIASDACEEAGLVLAQISNRTVARLRKYLPPAASTHNPVDILGDADALLYAIAVEALLDDAGVDGVLVILTPQAMTEIYRTADEVIRVARNAHKTVLCSFMGAGSVDAPVNRLQKAGIPNIPFPDRAMLALGRMYERELELHRPVSRAARFDVDKDAVDAILSRYLEKDEIQVDAGDCREVLGAYGIPFAPYKFAPDLRSARRVAQEMGYPVVMKVVSPQILHKTDVGGVILNIRNTRELGTKYDDMMGNVRRLMPGAEVHGVGIQKMVPSGHELILGIVKDPQFGAMIMVGLGGIYVEAFKDVVFRLAPISPGESARMLRELQAFRLLEGVRGEPPADVEAVEEILQRLSCLALDHPELGEMDINPLMVYNSGDGCTCVDVRMTLGG